MHGRGRADDAVGRAGLDAERAAYAPGFVDDGDAARGLDAIDGVQRQGRAAGEGGEPGHARGAAGGALVDLGLTRGDGVGVAAAVRIAAAGALGLRQRGVDQLREAHALRLRAGAGLAVALRGTAFSVFFNGAASYLAMKSRTSG